MKKVITGQAQKPRRVPAKALKRAQTRLVPIPAAVRQKRKMELWRDRFWRARNKHLMLLEPQYRELVRKMCYVMEKVGLSTMVGQLFFSLLFIYFFTGSVQKMEEFILEVFNGKVFLIDNWQKLPLDLPRIELIRRLLLYNPKRYPDGCSLETISQATRFPSWLGPVPEVKPWVEQWELEKEETRRQAGAEIGEELANTLWAEPSWTKESGNADKGSVGKDQQPSKKVSYW